MTKWWLVKNAQLHLVETKLHLLKKTQAVAAQCGLRMDRGAAAQRWRPAAAGGSGQLAGACARLLGNSSDNLATVCTPPCLCVVVCVHLLCAQPSARHQDSRRTESWTRTCCRTRNPPIPCLFPPPTTLGQGAWHRRQPSCSFPSIPPPPPTGSTPPGHVMSAEEGDVSSGLAGGASVGAGAAQGGQARHLGLPGVGSSGPASQAGPAAAIRRLSLPACPRGPIK